MLLLLQEITGTIPMAGNFFSLLHAYLVFLCWFSIWWTLKDSLVHVVMGVGAVYGSVAPEKKFHGRLLQNTLNEISSFAVVWIVCLNLISWNCGLIQRKFYKQQNKLVIREKYQRREAIFLRENELFFSTLSGYGLILYSAHVWPYKALWCSGYHYCTTSFNKFCNQALRRFKSCLRRVGDSRWWGSLTIVSTGNKAKRLLSVNHTTKAIHHHSSYKKVFRTFKT